MRHAHRTNSCFGSVIAFAFAAASLMTAGSALSQSQSSGTPNTASTPGQAGMAGMDHGTMMKGMGSGGTMDMHGAMMQGMKDMEAVPMTGDTDRDFASMMRMHHQQAVNMAQVELKNGKDARLKAMAKRIIDSQSKEIKEFDDWLTKNKK